MTTLHNLIAIADIKWQEVTIGTVKYFGVPMYDGVMFYIPETVPAHEAVAQVKALAEKGMVKL